MCHRRVYGHHTNVSSPYCFKCGCNLHCQGFFLRSFSDNRKVHTSVCEKTKVVAGLAQLACYSAHAHGTCRGIVRSAGDYEKPGMRPDLIIICPLPSLVAKRKNEEQHATPRDSMSKS